MAASLKLHRLIGIQAIDKPSLTANQPTSLLPSKQTFSYLHPDDRIDHDDNVLLCEAQLVQDHPASADPFVGNGADIIVMQQKARAGLLKHIADCRR